MVSGIRRAPEWFKGRSDQPRFAWAGSCLPQVVENRSLGDFPPAAATVELSGDPLVRNPGGEPRVPGNRGIRHDARRTRLIVQMTWQFARDCLPTCRSCPPPTAARSWSVAVLSRPGDRHGQLRRQPEETIRLCVRWSRTDLLHGPSSDLLLLTTVFTLPTRLETGLDTPRRSDRTAPAMTPSGRCHSGSWFTHALRSLSTGQRAHSVRAPARRRSMRAWLSSYLRV